MPNDIQPESNPYSVPKAVLADAQDIGGNELLDSPRRVSAGAGTTWVGGGWRLFKSAPLIWIGMFLAYLVITVALGKFPLVGAIIKQLATTWLFAGMMIGCDEVHKGGKLRFGHLFCANDRLGKLVITGLLSLLTVGGFMLVILIALGATLGAIIGFATLSAGLSSTAAFTALLTATPIALLLAVLAGLLIFPLSIVVTMAPALVVLNDCRPLQSLSMAVSGGLRNIVPVTLYALLALLLVVISLIPVGLGLLVVFPTLIGAQYFAYRDIFLKD